MRRCAIASLLVACAALCGCGSGSQRARNRSLSGPLAQAQATHEYPSPPPPVQTASTSAADPTQAIRAFASAYINWSADTVEADMQALATESVGQARSAMSLAAAETASDYELQRGGISNSGTVEAVSPLLGHANQYVVVTRELTRATATTAYQGLRPAWHIALATVAQLGSGRWVVSSWQPES